MKRVRVHNKEELLYAINFYHTLKPNSQIKLSVFDFDEEIYKHGVSVGYEENGNNIYLFWSTSNDLGNVSMLGRQRSE